MRKCAIDPVTKVRSVAIKETVIRNKFGLWLHQNMIKHEMKHSDIAKKLHITRSSVTGHASGYHKPTFMNVVSYCWVFGSKDDPEEIWKLVNEKIEEA